MIRIFDVILSMIGLIICFPIFLIITIWIRIDSKGSILYKQERVGYNCKPFFLLKFRSMYIGSDSKGLITVGNRDSRITKSGYYLRKFKIDELPQLFNVIKGDMSIVGPRPEVRKYVKLYSKEQRKILEIKPGITDYASIEYIDENFILSKAVNPDKAYIYEILPNKIKLNMKYINNKSISEYFKIIFLTIFKIFR